MSTASPEVLAVVNEFKDRLKPAVLKDTKLNGMKIAMWINDNRGGTSSADAMYAATLAIYASLEWTVKPAILVRDEQAAKVTKIKPLMKQEDDFAQKVREGEARDAKNEKDADARLQIESAIAAFQPIKNGKIVFGLQAEQQARLRRYVAQQGPNIDPTSILEQVRKEISRLYSDLEKSQERR